MSREGPVAAAAVPTRPAILYLVHRLPYPPDKGDRIRTFHLLRSLSRRAALHLASLADESLAEGTIEVLRRFCWESCLESFAPLLELSQASAPANPDPAISAGEVLE
jgi:hypothetical protein